VGVSHSGALKIRDLDAFSLPCRVQTYNKCNPHVSWITWSGNMVVFQSMLRITTVLPHAWHGGSIILGKLPGGGRSHEIRIVATAAGESTEVANLR